MPDSPAWDLFRKEGVRIGTASWTDKTLIDSGAFYPGDAKKPDQRLAFYASNFPVVEVDSTYYGLPSQKNAELWVERTPDDFVFNVKAFALLTQHPTNARDEARYGSGARPTSWKSGEGGLVGTSGREPNLNACR